MSRAPSSLEARFVSVLELIDPIERLRALHELAADAEELPRGIREARADAVLELRAQGKTWRAIGDLLGVSTQRAEQLARRPESRA